MDFDLSKLRTGERIAAAGGVLLFILLFFHWYEVSVGVAGFSISGGVSAWDAFSVIDIYLLIVSLVAVGLAALTATQRTPALPVTAAVITTAVAAFGTLLILFRIVDTPGLGLPSQIDVSPTFWAFAGLVVCAGITYGGYLSMRDEGTSLDDVRDQARAAGQQAKAAFDTAAPAREESAGASPASAPPPPAADEPVGASEPPPAFPSPSSVPTEPPSGSYAAGNVGNAAGGCRERHFPLQGPSFSG